MTQRGYGLALLLPTGFCLPAPSGVRELAFKRPSFPQNPIYNKGCSTSSTHSHSPSEVCQVL